MRAALWPCPSAALTLFPMVNTNPAFTSSAYVIAISAAPETRNSPP